MADIALMAVVFAISFVVGYFLISNVPLLLHTPLMSMTNAISAVIILGALLLFCDDTSTTEISMGRLALAMASFNLVGGVVITDRMVQLFKSRRKEQR